MKSLTLALTLALVAPAALAAAPAVDVTQAWSRPAVAGGTGGGFMVLSNHGKTADALVKVESPAAREVQIHESSTAGGMSSMRPLARLAVPAGGSVAFAPGGYHLMFVGLKKPLNVGDSLPATFTFASGAKVTARVRVQVTPPLPATHSHP
jgi:copper(I)-binding protein